MGPELPTAEMDFGYLRKEKAVRSYGTHREAEEPEWCVCPGRAGG